MVQYDSDCPDSSFLSSSALMLLLRIESDLV